MLHRNRAFASRSRLDLHLQAVRQQTETRVQRLRLGLQLAYLCALGTAVALVVTPFVGRIGEHLAPLLH